MNQVTIWASLTDDTPRTVTALLADPRTDDDTGTATPAGPTASVHSGPAPIGPQTLPEARILPEIGGARRRRGGCRGW
jgi:hypothetical protein